jgi:hypothetical protein
MADMHAVEISNDYCRRWKLSGLFNVSRNSHSGLAPGL